MGGKLTLEDIAEELGYHKTTVSRAISGKGRIGSETRSRILSYCRLHGYEPAHASLSQTGTRNLAVVIPNDQEADEIPFFHICLNGICQMASQKGFDVLVTSTDDGDLSGLRRLVEEKKIDGVILTRALVDDPAEEYLLSHQVPFVVVGSSCREVVQVDNNHVEACRELTSRLIMRRYRHLALIGSGANHYVSKRRYQGFREGCEMHQVMVRQENLFMDCDTKDQVDRSVDILLGRNIDCIVCMDDKICSQVLMQLAEKKIEVPENLMVASFYSNSYLEQFNPQVATIRFDVKTLGIAACKTLTDSMDGKDIPRKTILGYNIIFRGNKMGA